jgi:3-dehydroquinate synthase
MPSPLETVHVDLGPRSYDIRIGAGNLPDLGSTLSQLGKVTHAVLITDQNVQEPHALAAAESLSGAAIRTEIIAVEPGELSKSIEVATALWGGLVELKADRRSVVVAVGGGVVGDLAGFVAATYARGLRFFQVPTTLLAQVDSSVGGKVGINLPEAKNMVGAFWQPLGVLIDTKTLSTLPEREYRSGLAEVVKYGVILDAEFFERLEADATALRARQSAVLSPVIARCCRLKADVVEKDEFEQSGHRAVLNFGHTFAHAFESLGGYGTLLHGEAVSIGMVCAARLAERLGRVDASFTQRLYDVLVAVGLPVAIPRHDPQAVLDAMMHDKKVQHGQLKFVLPDRLGHVEMVGSVASDDVQAVLQE